MTGCQTSVLHAGIPDPSNADPAAGANGSQPPRQHSVELIGEPFSVFVSLISRLSRKTFDQAQVYRSDNRKWSLRDPVELALLDFPEDQQSGCHTQPERVAGIAVRGQSLQ